jgi:hypothetical protein
MPKVRPPTTVLIGRVFFAAGMTAWTSVFQALAMTGIAFFLAATPLKRPAPAK